MSSDYYIQVGDKPEITEHIDGDLTKDGASVAFSMKPVVARGAVTVDKATVSVSDEDYDASEDETEVSYTLDSADTAESGDYLAEFEASYADGRQLSFPQGRYYYISISEDI